EAVDVATARAASEGQAAARARVVGDIDATRASLAEATKLLQNCRGRVERAEEIRAADAEAKTLIVEMASASQREEQAVSDARREAREIFDLERRIAGLGVRAERAREALRDRATVEQAEAGLADVDAEATAAAAAHAAAVAEVERLQGERVAGAEERIDGLRVGLARIASADGVPAHELQGSAHETLGEDDDAAAVAERHPAELAAAVAARGEAEARATAASKALDAYRFKVARRASIQHAEEELAAVERESAELTERRDACVTSADRRAVALAMLRLRRASQATRLEALAPVAKLLEGLVQAQGNLELRERQVATATERLAALEAELAGLPLPAPVEDGPDLETARGVVSHVEHLTREAAARAAAVKATRAELEPQLEAARAEVTRLDAELAALPAPAELPPLPDVDAARAESETAEQALRDASTAIARAEQRLGQARAAAAKIASLEEERSGLEYQLANWTRLELDFGRDGIQSALVDSAGPELSELANDLLRCHGTRFSVAIETKRAKSNGKGETDECRVLVVDSERGTQKEAREHSGGECVIIGEAISLALTMMACRRAGVVEPTLVRDESSAALDPESARAYVTMLRRAAAFVNAHRVLVVSHSREVQELCDSTITLPSRQRPEA
ncbi:MAG TPA: hypothetical protein VGK73_33370, partial [Polyangiaceae bacterium]